MVKKNFTSNYFLIIILISSAIYSLWSVKLLNDFPWRYVFTDWIINYEGGYIRRGLLGEISINLSNFLDLNIKYVFLLIHLSTYLLFHLLFYKFFSSFKKNYIFYLLCFSPLVFLYPITTFEAFARKEIFYITFFLLNCYLLIKIKNRNIAFFSTNLLVVLSYLIHETSILFIIFFYFSYYVFLTKNNYKVKISELGFIIIVYSILLFLLSIPVTDEKLSEMIYLVNQNFFELTKFSGAITWLQNDPSSAFLFLKYNHVSFKFVLQNILYLHFLLIFFYLLYINNFFKFGKYFFILTILSFFGPLILFIVWLDWGRLVYIFYNFCLIFTFYCLYNDKEVFIKIDKLPIINDLNYKLKLLVTVSYISLWTPKIFFYDDVEFFPLINLISDLVKYSMKYGALLF
ncbi:hypothetical protein OAT69_00895 [Candidatus Pelagibacter sp.]|nr:hypothetical protein [Candidatus Pelagibacter sp.]